MEGLATDDGQRFKSALEKALNMLDKTPELQPLPMDYHLGQVAQTMAELALSDQEVGTDALTIIGDATVHTTIGNDASIKYSRDPEDRDKPRGNNKNRRRPFRHPKLDIQCPGCKLWGHDNTTCNFLARTLFSLEYTKKNPANAEKIAEAFNRKNSKEAKAFIKTLCAYPAGPRPPPLDQTVATDDEFYDDNEDEDYFVEDYLSSMISGFGLSIRTAHTPIHPTNDAAAKDNNTALLLAVDPLALQAIHLPPFPNIAPPEPPSHPYADLDASAMTTVQ